ncbi:MAG: right-handed parallel beta-helix repeat-containing protein [Phycisphaerales bacterium]
MNRSSLVGVALACGALVACTAILSQAGPIDPPAGPVGPTYRTLLEVEPRVPINLTNTPGDADSLYKITQPGSYYLTGNVAGVANKVGIEIAASGVTIDLGGFELVGVGPGGGSYAGIFASVPGLAGITVRNGTTRGWAGAGVDLSSVLACRVDRVGAGANAGTGIVAGDGAVVVDCVAWGNGGSGILAQNGGAIRGCTARDNAGSGIVGAFVSVLNCTASENGESGFWVSNGSSIVGSTARENVAHGIRAIHSTVSDCSVWDNGVGILADQGTLVDGCTVIRSEGDGIEAGGECVLRGNSCRENGISTTGAGIHITGNDNRLEGNHCTNADFGIWVQGTTNVIVHNTCAGNTANWLLGVNNIYGGIIDRTTVTSAGVSGNAAAASTATSDPNANFSH